MRNFTIATLVVLAAAVAILMYVQRPSENAEQYAERKCTESRPSGITYEKCVEGYVLQRLAGRKDDER